MADSPIEPEIGSAGSSDHSGIITKGLYEDLALMSKNLTAPEYRVLVALLRDADGSDKDGRVPLGNCFPTNRRIARRIGRSESSVRIRLDSLESKGWIRRHPMQRRSSGRQTSNLFQFLIPPGETEPEDPGWEGPIHFSNRARSAQLVGDDHPFQRRPRC